MFECLKKILELSDLGFYSPKQLTLIVELEIIPLAEENNNSAMVENDEVAEENIVQKPESFSPIILRKRSLPSISSLLSQNANQGRRKTRDLPNMSICHGCGLRLPDKGRNESLHPLHSEWRVVFLCSDCLELVQSAKICSYCFSFLADSENNIFFDCLDCFCRVHLTCIPNQRGFVTPLDLDPCSFKCVDCCSLPEYFSVFNHVSYGGKEAVASRVAKSLAILNKIDVEETSKKKPLAVNCSSELGISALEVGSCDDGVIGVNANGSQHLEENVGCGSNESLGNVNSLEKHKKPMPINVVHLQGDNDINGPALSSSQGLDVLVHGAGEDSTTAQENHRYQKKYYCRKKLNTSPDRRYQIKYHCRKKHEPRKTLNNNKTDCFHVNMNGSKTSKNVLDTSEESGTLYWLIVNTS